jgi:hypothetical protein
MIHNTPLLLPSPDIVPGLSRLPDGTHHVLQILQFQWKSRMVSKVYEPGCVETEREETYKAEEEEGRDLLLV